MEKSGELSENDNSKKLWVENMYWTQFQTVRFGVLLSGDFTSQLVIPKKFSEKVRKRLPEKVSLRGPAGDSQNWEVQLNTSNNTTSLVGESWKDFIFTYGLKENDFLVFKYKYNSYFKVTILDKRSCWVEKESSYFVVKSDAPSTDHSEKIKQGKVANLREETSPQAFTDRNDESDRVLKGGVCKEKVLQDMSWEVAEDSDEDVEAMKRKNNDPEWKPAKKSRVERRSIRDTAESLRTPTGSKALEWPRDVFKPCQDSSFLYSAQKQGIPRRKSPSASYYDLNQKQGILGKRREPTDREKERAKQIAYQESTDESFSVVMAPSHVGKSCKLVSRAQKIYDAKAIQKRWADKYMFSCNQVVILRLTEQDSKEWFVTYYFDSKRCIGKFAGGWNQFVRDNALHESDVCVFKLAGQKRGNVCMDVKIIRVVEGESDHPLLINRMSGQGQE